MPKLLRLADVREARRLKGEGAGTIGPSLSENARGLAAWSGALERGSLPTDDIKWPQEPLRAHLVAALARLRVAPLAARFPPVHHALVAAILDAVLHYDERIGGSGATRDDAEPVPAAAAATPQPPAPSE